MPSNGVSAVARDFKTCWFFLKYGHALGNAYISAFFFRLAIPKTEAERAASRSAQNIVVGGFITLGPCRAACDGLLLPSSDKILRKISKCYKECKETSRTDRNTYLATLAHALKRAAASFTRHGENIPSLVMNEMNSLTHSCMHSLASLAILAFSGNAVFIIRATGAKLCMMAVTGTTVGIAKALRFTRRATQRYMWKTRHARYSITPVPAMSRERTRNIAQGRECRESAYEMIRLGNVRDARCGYSPLAMGDGGAGSTSSGSRGLALCDIFNCLASCRSRIEQAAVPVVPLLQVDGALCDAAGIPAGGGDPASEEASNLGTRSVVAVYLDVVNCRASLQIRGQIHFPQGLRQ
ncbi:hypothetical protein KC349_g95 [Hortaea werneckii]|nr:hypothetical protein KC349_g95 [Hortaea werneckii]